MTNRDDSFWGTFLLGAAVGAAFVTVANKNSRKKVKNYLHESLEKGDETLDELENKAKDAKSMIDKKSKKMRKKALNKASKKLSETKKKIDTAK